jgi:hypothetical protein
MLKVGEKIKVHHADEGEAKYILDVEVTAICSPNEFKGRIDRVFSNWGDRGEIAGGDILALIGTERTFKNEHFA